LLLFAKLRSDVPGTLDCGDAGGDEDDAEGDREPELATSAADDAKTTSLYIKAR
jgi:hypothetical protein